MNMISIVGRDGARRMVPRHLCSIVPSSRIPAPKPAEVVKIVLRPIKDEPDEIINTFPAPKMSQIMRAACVVFNLEIDQLLSANRFRHLVAARHVAMWYAKTYTALSYPEIGRRIGGKDHSTVNYSFQKIEARKAEFQPMIDQLHAEICRMNKAAEIAP